MKNFIIALSLLLLSITSYAQAPQGIPYQAAARNSSGAVLASTSISVRFTIRDSVTTGVIKYRETHSTTTDANGMFSLTVGQGTPVSGSFASINWAANAKFMQVELDPAGGSSYIDIGTQQMMSVPYALNAGSLNLTVSATGDTLYSGGGNYLIIPGISAANCTVSAGTITGTAFVTAGSTTSLNNTTTGGTWSSSATAIATVGTGGIVSGIAAGTATISYTVTNTCGSAVATRVVTVTIGVGASYGGGIVAYILQSGDPGYVAGQTKGLIAAPSDQSSGINWGCYGTLVGGTGAAIGTGVANTSAISAECGTGTASRLCTDLVLGGFNDWYLPSIYELNKIYINRFYVGGFSAGRYWSSTEEDANFANSILFSTGITYPNNKYNTYYVRAVRTFTCPETGSIFGTPTVCAGSSVTLSNATTGGTWSSSATSIATVNSSGLVSGVSLGTAIISYTVTESCGSATTTLIVTVNPLPSAGTITGTASVTAGNTTTLGNATTGGTWSSSNTSIAIVGTSGIVSGISVGTASISYTVTSTCGIAVATQVVTVNALTIGVSYGGGVIAYILQPGDPGYIAGETHGIIAAPSDQSASLQWYNGIYISTGATGTALGTGMSNTNAIVAAQGAGSYAAKLCADLVLNGYSDWYLPSINELNKIYTNRVSVGGFTTGFYWSSSDFNTNHASNLYFSTGVIGFNDKGGADRVRAVRSF